MSGILDKDAKRIFTRKQLFGVLVVCGLALYLMLPSDPQLLEDLVQDGKMREARRELEKVPVSERQRDPIRYALAEQRILEAEWGRISEGASAYLIDSILRWEENGFDPRLSKLWVDDLPLIAEPEEVWFALNNRWASVPSFERRSLIEALVDFALQRERADLAAGLHAATFGDSPSKEKQALELARLFRLSGNPQKAITALEATNGSVAGDLRVALLRELNANEEALAQLMARIRAEENVTREQILLLGEIARGAGQAEQAIADLKQFLMSHSDDLELNRLLVILERESGRAVDAANSQERVVELSERPPEELREWGRLLEGAGQPNEAFDVWAELAPMGDKMALERLLALNPGLFRDEELANVLLKIVPVENHAEYSLQLAEILTKLGRYDEAVAGYELYFESAPRDTNAMVALAVLEIELYRYDEAAKWLERAKNTAEANSDLRRRLANAWTSIGEFELALQEYRELAEITGLADDYGNYFRLARGLGAYDDFVAGLEGVVASEEAGPSDYLTLAYGYQLLGEDLKAKDTLRGGMSRFPENAEMPMRLAYAYSDAKLYREAQEIVELHPHLGKELEPTRLYLILMRLNNDLRAEDAFVKQAISPVIAADPESKQLIARIHMMRENFEVAERMLREIHDDFPDDWDITGDLIGVLLRQNRTEEANALLKPLLDGNSARGWQLAAEVASGLGEFGDAERYQSRYLSMIDPVPAVDWGALGDIRLSRGDVEGSKRAYRKALRQLQLTLLEGQGAPR